MKGHFEGNILKNSIIAEEMGQCDATIELFTQFIFAYFFPGTRADLWISAPNEIADELCVFFHNKPW